MQSGMTLERTATQVANNARNAQDLILSPSQLQMDSDARIRVVGDDRFDHALPLTNHAQNQVASHTGIGKRYWNKMMEHGSEALLADNVNHWLRRNADQNNNNRRMVRTLDNEVRAFLSDKYLRLDNQEVLETAMTALADVGADGSNIKSSYVDSDNMYLKVVFPWTEQAVKVGDPVQSGVVIRNNEVGSGSYSIHFLLYRLICLNGMMRADQNDGFVRRHTGGRVTSDSVIYQADTMSAMQTATIKQTRDAIRTFASPEYFRSQVETLQAAASGERARNPEKAVEVLQKQMSLADGERSSILERFIRDQDYSQYGLMNAVTNLANDTSSYDRATELEQLGGKVLSLKPRQWESIAQAA